LGKSFLFISYFVCILFAAESLAQTFDSIPPLRAVVQATGAPLYAPIWSPLYELSGNSIFPGSPYVQTTLYEPYNDFTRGWWDNIFEEFMYAGICNSLILTRATVTESREWDTLKTNLMPALARAGISPFMKFGQFEDCGAWLGTFKNITGHDTIDWSDTTTMIRIMWDLCVKRFFDFMPVQSQLQYEGKPVWVGWGSGGINLQKNVSKVLREVKKRFKVQYNKDLFVIIDNSWRKGDSSITGAEADGVQNWFCCGNAGTFFTWNTVDVGVCVPGFGIFDSVGAPKAHGATFDRGHGARLKQFLDSSVSVKADIMIEEGYVDIRESAGIYRSPSWDFPSQYLEIVREFLDQKTETRRFQAEACDSFYNKSNTNAGGSFSLRKLDAWPLSAPDAGWYVGGTEAGDWLTWKNALFANGAYDLFVRYSTAGADNRLVISLAGKNDTVSLPATSGVFRGKKIVSSRSLSGNNDVRITFLTPGTQLDFLQVNLSNVSAVTRKADASPQPDRGITMKQCRSGARLEYSLPFDNGAVEIDIVTPAGRMVRQFHETGSEKGRHSIGWGPAQCAPGVYFVRMVAKDGNGNIYALLSQKCILF